MSDFTLLLAKEMGVTPRTVRRWCNQGKIPGAYRTKGGHWRLRKPRGRFKRGDKIDQFVMRYTSPEGYWTPRNVDELGSAITILRDADRKLEDPSRISVGGVLQTISRLEWARMVITQHYAKEMDELTATPEFNQALEFSMVAKGIAEYDRPANPRDYKAWKEFEERDPETFQYLMKTSELEMIHPRAYEALKRPNGRLMVKSQKLRLNGRKVTPAALAGELKYR
jgi:excisionase family DNA binding protein